MGSFWRRVLLGRGGVPASLITGVVGLDGDGGWSVFAGEGLEPGEVRARTLTEVTDSAAAAVAALYAQYSPVEGAELQLAIYPGKYSDGPIFDVIGEHGSILARYRDSDGLQWQAAALEELVTAIEHHPRVPSDNWMLRWIRPVASLPLTV